ncbi:hypothetical protein MLD38_040003 [Melastoma candidum]|uniref:Uncharacterized protein n=1 Tax=Melastoma candidum TaxID=119954 RepID=A0ACB9L5H2_9MYRT|nr:hypothetical protein MLD38_040003 [Melastoma candidum]
MKKECNAQQNSWAAYQENKVMELLKVIDETSDEIGYNNYHAEVLGSTGTCYIHVTCSRNIKREDCSSCLENAMDKINRECRLSIGAWVDYVNCRFEFKNYKFY